MRAVIDRFVHLCHVVNRTGKSYCLQQYGAREARQIEAEYATAGAMTIGIE